MPPGLFLRFDAGLSESLGPAEKLSPSLFPKRGVNEKVVPLASGPLKALPGLRGVVRGSRPASNRASAIFKGPQQNRTGSSHGASQGFSSKHPDR